MSGTQIRKLAKPMMKKVGISSWNFESPPSKSQIFTNAVLAHTSIAPQNIRSVIFSIILITTSYLVKKLYKNRLPDDSPATVENRPEAVFLVPTGRVEPPSRVYESLVLTVELRRQVFESITKITLNYQLVYKLL